MSLALKIALAYIGNRKRQTIISTFGVILGVAFFIGVAGMMKGFHQYFIEKLINTSPHVTIKDEFRNSPKQPIYEIYPNALIELRGIKPKEEKRGIRSARKIIKELKKTSALHYSPILRGNVFLHYGGKDLTSILFGIDPELERHASNLEKDMVSGNLNSLLIDANGIIVGKELLDKIGARLGSRLTVISPAGIIKSMKIVGIFNTGVTDVDASRTYASLKKVQILQDKEDVINQINIRLDDINKSPEIAKKLEDKFLYRTESWQETFKNLFEMFVIEDFIMYTVVAAILIVACFGIYNIISNIIREKSRDIAILKSIGFSENDIQRIFLYQGLLIGICGTIIGWILGAILIEILASLEIGKIEDLPITFKGFPVYRSWWLYAIGGISANIASALAAYIPAKRAASLNPVEIIRGAV